MTGNEAMTGSEAILKMFKVFNNADAERIKIYIDELKVFPPGLIKKACLKAVFDYKFLPSISEITDCIISLVATANEEIRVRDWDEAETEIMQAVNSYNYTLQKPFKFSTREIADAVASIGGIQAIALGKKDNVQFLLERCKNNYEKICRRKIVSARNAYFLGKEPATALIGLPDSSDGLTPTKDIIRKLIKEIGEADDKSKMS